MLKGTVVNKVEEYPCLKQAKSTGRVVLFSSPNTGTCLVKGREGSLGVGFHQQGWAEEDFVRISGHVTVEEI